MAKANGGEGTKGVGWCGVVGTRDGGEREETGDAGCDVGGEDGEEQV